LIQQAGNVLKADLPKSFSDMSVVMEKLQLSNNSSRRFEEFIVEYLRSRGGRKIVGLLQKAWKS
jgi:hypothetical protein